jgi:hypothetical protein
MRWGTRQRLRWIWIACCAVLMNTLAPSVSQAFADSGPDRIWGDICTASTSTAGKGAPAGPGAHAACVFCAAHAASFMLPPPACAPWKTGAANACVPVLVRHAPPPFLALVAAPPRGPPALA